MDDLVLVEVFESIDYLSEIALDLDFSESFSSFDQFVESLYEKDVYLVGAEFQEDVDILVVFKHMLELHNILVMQRFVDLDFRNELGNF